ncbi:hypothetical protein DFQ28_005235 [Apophysomyces sp. BC1034]|nr:hypothetical protein DFQ30_010303 [Apophysomyces sp. BC1015]KAG0170775.1 hypothetical protein DFQ29_009113 [Apophysomyces sp. BC1021]KAG0188199.1 hypothetical protein DFQ28_005235 [Apophysomyces sp. BC1034]
MNIADMLNPKVDSYHHRRHLLSPPLSPKQQQQQHSSSRGFFPYPRPLHGKPRSRFSDLEDAIICEGVAKGMTWGQISSQLPHRKRATCFNRYRTLQGIRKSRKRSPDRLTCHVSPLSPSSPISAHPSSSSSSSSPWLPTTPPPMSLLPHQMMLADDVVIHRKTKSDKDDVHSGRMPLVRLPSLVDYLPKTSHNMERYI